MDPVDHGLLWRISRFHSSYVRWMSATDTPVAIESRRIIWEVIGTIRTSRIATIAAAATSTFAGWMRRVEMTGAALGNGGYAALS